jgi:hypothetical protein
MKFHQPLNKITYLNAADVSTIPPTQFYYDELNHIKTIFYGGQYSYTSTGQIYRVHFDIDYLSPNYNL